MNESRAELDQPKYEKYFAESEQLKGNFDLGQGSVEVCPSTLGFDETNANLLSYRGQSERKYLPVKIAGNWRLFYKSGSTKEWRQLIAALPATSKNGNIDKTWWIKDDICDGRAPWELHKYLVEAENNKLISFASDPEVLPEDVFENTGGTIGSQEEKVDVRDQSSLRHGVNNTKAGEVFKKYLNSFEKTGFLDETGKPKELPDFTEAPKDVIYNDGTVDCLWQTENFRFRINIDPRPEDNKRSLRSSNPKLIMPLNCIFIVESVDPHRLVTNVPTYEQGGKADPQFLEIIEKIKQSEIYQKIENQTERLIPETFKALIS